MVEKNRIIFIFFIIVLVSFAVYAVGLLSVSLDEPDFISVEEKGVRLSLNHSGQTLAIGDILNYTVELRNVNSPSKLYLYQSVGYSWPEIHNASGTVIELGTGRYAWGPLGLPKEQFFKGHIWSWNSYWDTGHNFWDNSPSSHLSPGNYTLVMKVRYGIIGQENEIIEISVPLILIKT